MAVIHQRGGWPTLVVDDKMHAAWQALNPTERYFSLLEVWLLHGNREILGEREGLFPVTGNIDMWLYFFAAIPDEGLAVAGSRDEVSWLRYRPGVHNLGLLDLFGLIDVQTADPEPGGGWKIVRILRNPLGDALLALIASQVFADYRTLSPFGEVAEEARGILQPLVRTYFPQWQHTLPAPKHEHRAGRHVLKVALGSWWCRITTPDAATLDDLAYAILGAVKFDSDHLYEFRYLERTGVKGSALDPRMGEGRDAAETSVGDVPLEIGQGMTFIYDFGDWWEFNVTLEDFDANATGEELRLVEVHGSPPEQYPSWDDDWE